MGGFYKGRDEERGAQGNAAPNACHRVDLVACPPRVDPVADIAPLGLIPLGVIPFSGLGEVRAVIPLSGLGELRILGGPATKRLWALRLWST